jgi:hypothetical protein
MRQKVHWIIDDDNDDDDGAGEHCSLFLLLSFA